MFIVINKSKVFSYILAVFTVFVLFLSSTIVNKSNLNNTIATSAKNENTKEYKLRVNENKIEILIDEKSNKIDAENLLKMLKNEKTEITILDNE